MRPLMLAIFVAIVLLGCQNRANEVKPATAPVRLEFDLPKAPEVRPAAELKTSAEIIDAADNAKAAAIAYALKVDSSAFVIYKITNLSHEMEAAVRRMKESIRTGKGVSAAISDARQAVLVLQKAVYDANASELLP
jgi:hypothetical protein